MHCHYTLVDVLALWVAGEAAAAGDAADALWVEQEEAGRMVGWSETVRIIERGCRMHADDPADPAA